MKLDYDLVRDILSFAENGCDGFHFHGAAEIADTLSNDVYDIDTLYSVRTLIRDGYLEGRIQDELHKAHDDVIDITIRGRELLYILDNPELLQRIIKKLDTPDNHPLSIIQSIGHSVIVQSIVTALSG